MSEPLAVFARSSAAPPDDPPPPAPSSMMVAPLPSHVNQRRVVQAVVRTNPRLLRHQGGEPKDFFSRKR